MDKKKIQNERADALQKVKELCKEFGFTAKMLQDALADGGRRNKWGERLLAKLRRDGLISTIQTIVLIPFTLKYRVAHRKMLKREPLAERFKEIYEKNFWGSNESGSGEGSEVEYTEGLRNWLIETLPRHNIKKIVDAGCGDFNWMRLVVPKLNIEYRGFDIVESVIEKNSTTYATDKIHFEVIDICRGRLPSCDLLLVRDCLFHFANKEINKFLINISNVNYKYLLTTTHIVDPNFLNKDIVTGDFRLIDLFKKPFNFRKDSVLDSVDDYPSGYSIPRRMVMIGKSDVPREMNLEF